MGARVSAWSCHLDAVAAGRRVPAGRSGHSVLPSRAWRGYSENQGLDGRAARHRLHRTVSSRSPAAGWRSATYMDFRLE